MVESAWWCVCDLASYNVVAQVRKRALQFALRMVVYLRQRTSGRARLTTHLLGFVALLSAIRKAHRIFAGTALAQIDAMRTSAWNPTVAMAEEVFTFLDDMADNLVFLTLLIPNQAIARYLRRRFSRIADIGLLFSSMARFYLIRRTRAGLWDRGRMAYEALQADKAFNAPEASARRKLRRAELIAIKSRLRWLRWERVQVFADLVFACPSRCLDFGSPIELTRAQPTTSSESGWAAR